MGMGGLFQGGVPKLRPVGGKHLYLCVGFILIICVNKHTREESWSQSPDLKGESEHITAVTAGIDHQKFIQEYSAHRRETEEKGTFCISPELLLLFLTEMIHKFTRNSRGDLEYK